MGKLRPALAALLLFLYAVPAAARPAAWPAPSPAVRIYALNTSDDVFFEWKRRIAASRRYRGNYVKEFPFRDVAYAEYVLQEGETLHDVATALGTAVDSIAAASGIVFFYAARPGQRLLIPDFEGIVFQADKHITTAVLSRKYGIREAEIRRYNRLPANRIAAGQWVYVPGAIMAPLEQALFYGTAFASPLPDGVLTSPFGFRRHPVSGRHAFHGGIDLAAPTGTPVLAAHAGEVEFAGTAGGYGKLVVIRHAFGYRTFYGHLSVIQVRPGAKVQLGMILGQVGSTGVSTGPHLHFEIRHYTRHVDPTRYTSLEHGSRHFRVQ